MIRISERAYCEKNNNLNVFIFKPDCIISNYRDQSGYRAKLIELKFRNYLQNIKFAALNKKE